jgi:hypothetical protein
MPYNAPLELIAHIITTKGDHLISSQLQQVFGEAMQSFSIQVLGSEPSSHANNKNLRVAGVYSIRISHSFLSSVISHSAMSGGSLLIA